MKKTGTASEIRRLAAPFARLIDGAWQRMHWWVIAMAILYSISGVTVVKPDEVAVILRWGRLVGATPALQEKGPGLLFALPRPIDQVVRVQVKHVSEVRVSTLASYEQDSSNTLDPLTQGYALTGDQNIVHVDMIAHYRVRDPALWAFYGPNADEVLRVEVASAMVRSLGEMGVDRVLSDGREALVAIATRRAQEGLDACQSGLELSLLELTELAPPLALSEDFDAVQSAYIGAQTQLNNAQAFAQSAIPKAHADADAAVQTAQGDAAAALAIATGEGSAFLALEREYKASPAVVRERLYRDALDHAIGGAGNVRWVPPPVGGTYRGLLITLPPDNEVSPRSSSGAQPPPPAALQRSPSPGPVPSAPQAGAPGNQQTQPDDEDEEP